MASLIIRFSLLIFLLSKFQSSQTPHGEISLSVKSNFVSSMMIQHFRLRGGSASKTMSRRKRTLDDSNNDRSQDSDGNGESKKFDDNYDSNVVVEGSDLPSDLHESGLR